MSKVNEIINNSIAMLISKYNLAKVISLKGRKAVRLSHLNQHISDLELARKSLDFIEVAGEYSSTQEIIYWNFAIIFYIKCFTGGSKRTQLDRNKIYKGNVLGLDNFNFYYDIRNKNLIHDENPFSRSIPAGLLNKEGVLPKIKGTFLIGIHGTFIGLENLRNLKTLIDQALAWANAESKSISTDILNDLEKEQYLVLFNMPEPEEFVDHGTSFVGTRRNGDF